MNSDQCSSTWGSTSYGVLDGVGARFSRFRGREFCLRGRELLWSVERIFRRILNVSSNEVERVGVGAGAGVEVMTRRGS
jgi:hypothetical protein